MTTYSPPQPPRKKLYDNYSVTISYNISDEYGHYEVRSKTPLTAGKIKKWADSIVKTIIEANEQDL